VHMYFRLMAAIFDLPLNRTSECIHTGPTVLLDHGDVEVADGILLLSYVSKPSYMLHIHFRLMAAIFNLSVTLTSVCKN